MSAKRRRDPVYENPTGRSAGPEAVALRRWIHQRYLADPEALPGRFRYYEAIMAGVIDKHAAQTIADSGENVTQGDRLWKAALMWVREHRLVPDEWITDRTRSVVDYSGYPTFVDGVVEFLPTVTIDPWAGDWPLLIVESESSAAAPIPVAQEYRVPLVPLRGQASRSFLHNDVAPLMHDGQTVLVVVDLDKVGGDISDSAEERLTETTGFTFKWEVISITDDQVDEYNIVRVPRTDGRETKNPVTRMVAETEALGATNLRAIVRAELDARLPVSLDVVRQTEDQERALVRRLLGMAS